MTDRQAGIHTQKVKQAGRHRHTARQTNWQADIQTDRQTKQAGRQTPSHKQTDTNRQI